MKKTNLAKMVCVTAMLPILYSCAAASMFAKPMAQNKPNIKPMYFSKIDSINEKEALILMGVYGDCAKKSFEIQSLNPADVNREITAKTLLLGDFRGFSYNQYNFPKTSGVVAYKVKVGKVLKFDKFISSQYMTGNVLKSQYFNLKLPKILINEKAVYYIGDFTSIKTKSSAGKDSCKANFSVRPTPSSKLDIDIWSSQVAKQGLKLLPVTYFKK